MKHGSSVLHADISQLKTDVSQLKANVDKLGINVAKLNGRDLECQLRERPFVYLRRFALRLKAVGDAELAVLLEDVVERGLLIEEEAEDAKLLDAVACSRRRSDAVPIYLAVETSVVIDPYDLERAARWAATVEKASGVPTLALVARESILGDLRQTAECSGAGWVILP